SEDELLALAAAVEAPSEHPLAQAILRAAEERNLPLPTATDFQATAGVGVRAEVGGATVAVGGPALLAHHGAAAVATDWYDHGHTVLHVVREGQVLGALALADKVRPESRAA